MDAGFDENQAELGVHVLAVALQVLAHAHSLLDQAIEILRQGRREALAAKDRKIFELVTVLTCAMPWLSRSMTPIWLGVIPFFAILTIISVTSVGVIFNQLGAERL